MLKIIAKSAQFAPQPMPKPIPDPSWKGNPPPEWENDPRGDLETHATQQEENAKQIALSFKSQDTLTNLYLAKELLAQEGGYEDMEELLGSKIQELAYGDNAVEELGQRNEEERMGRGDYLRDQMKDDSFQWDNPW